MSTMQVEVFEVDEVAEMSPEDLECASALVNKLNLHGQKALMSQSATRVRWREMTKAEHFVFKLLFPVEEQLATYDKGPIPLRVLGVAETASESGFFDADKPLVIWRPEAASDLRRDPVLIGCRKHPLAATEKWRGNLLYPLARWGEALDEWPVLLRRAIDIAKARLARVRDELDADARCLDTLTESDMPDSFSPSYFRQFRSF